MNGLKIQHKLKKFKEWITTNSVPGIMDLTALKLVVSKVKKING